MWVQVVLLSALVSGTHGDIYMHNLRGSNNRVNGQGRDRTNGNRLFDSQNNARGGYNSGPGMTYYVGSELMIEYTSQHTCGERNSNCEIVMQYMCHSLIRDGGREDTIPEDKYSDKCDGDNCETDFQFGMHETHEEYETCLITKRNHGLYNANQNLQTHTAKTTRQNAGGTRRGLECPEEKDHYPYWRPSMWKDVAIMTNDISRCEYYRNESQNVKDRYYCKVPCAYRKMLKDYEKKRRIEKHMVIPITKEECENLVVSAEVLEKYGEDCGYEKEEIIDAAGGTIEAGSGTTDEPDEAGETEEPEEPEEPKEPKVVRGIWTRVGNWSIDPPECVLSNPSRDNHNGNGQWAQMNNFNWTVPDDPHKSCIFRIRYNISTNDFDAWDTNSRDNGRGDEKGGPDLNIDFGIHPRTAQDKGFYHRNNPEVEPFRVLENGQDIGKKFKLRLNFNTAQFGRTFQDRSHAFTIIRRPEEIPASAKIYNVNVRGKRGNIVQTYPAMEYDYIPNRLNVTTEDYIHFQWTGADTNPGNNAGQGTAKTDRSNICLLKGSSNPSEPADPADMHGRYGVNIPADLREGPNFLGVDDESEWRLCTAGIINGDNGNGELNTAFAYYNHKLVQCKIPGVWHYMCSRNNNFTNRSQKGRITCNNATAAAA